MSQGSATELLFGSYRRLILGFLMPRAQESFHVRELSRLTGVPVGSLHRELTALAEAGVLTRTPLGHQVRYQVNPECPIAGSLSGIFTGAAAQAQQGTGAGPAEPGPLGKLGIRRAALAEVCQRHGVRRLWLVGSAAEGEYEDDGALELMVAFDPQRGAGLLGFADLRAALSELAGGRDLRLITEGAVRNPIRKKSLERRRAEAYAA